jgi:hypothetical protein
MSSYDFSAPVKGQQCLSGGIDARTTTIALDPPEASAMITEFWI